MDHERDTHPPSVTERPLSVSEMVAVARILEAWRSVEMPQGIPHRGWAHIAVRALLGTHGNDSSVTAQAEDASTVSRDTNLTDYVKPTITEITAEEAGR